LRTDTQTSASVAARGRRPLIHTIIAKELRALFTSPLAWWCWLSCRSSRPIFLTRVDYFLTIQPRWGGYPTRPMTEIIVVPMFGIASIVLLMSVPLLTMRLIAEGRRNKTMTMPVAPVSMTQIVLGKFLATAIFPPWSAGSSRCWPITADGRQAGLRPGRCESAGGAAGQLCAIGLFVSCLTTHPCAAIGASRLFLNFG
jgi:ABC-2 type transport system permease protein